VSVGKKFKKKMGEVRAVMGTDGADPEEIKAKTKDLQEASWKVTQQAYQQASADEAGSEEKAKDSKFEEEKKEGKKEEKK